MKKIKIVLYTLFIGLGTLTYAQDNVGIGTTTPDASAALEVKADDKGMLVPRITSNQRNAIGNPAEGLLVYDTDVECFFYFHLSDGWKDLCTGLQGAQGPQGDPGPAGANGDDGLTALVNATPVAPGYDCENGGIFVEGGLDLNDDGVLDATEVTWSEFICNGTGGTGSVGPKGDKGDQGDPGPQGIQGPAGPKGDQGEPGPQGIQGPAGATGATGPEGPAGPKGDKGDQGDPGPAGATGPKGDTGNTGATGPQGIQGPAGPAGPAGATGPAGPKGDKGDTGNTGATGPQGIQGPAGPTGPAGATGATGPKGDKGDTGNTGATGPQGIQGPVGPAGATGATGPAGPKGDKGDPGTWDDETAWLIDGNTGTTVSNNFLGTIDNQGLAIRTNNIERMRITNGGQGVFNNTAPFSDDMFSSYGNASIQTSIAGYAVHPAGYGVYGQNSGATGTGIFGFSNEVGVEGAITANGLAAVWGDGVGANGRGVIGLSEDRAGVQGQTVDGIAGVYGSSTDNVGVLGDSDLDVGVQGQTTSGDAGVLGISLISKGVVGESNLNNGVNGYSVNSAGVLGESSATEGVIGVSFTNSGTGIVGLGNASQSTAYYTMTDGSGGAFTGMKFGVFGRANGHNNTESAGGIFTDSIGSGINQKIQVQVAAFQGATQYKIIGDGTVSTVVKDTEEKEVIMFAAEAPEILFEDYGQGQLVNGEAYIELDPTFAKNIVVNEKHPLRVLVQLEGDCMGVYVTEKTDKGFKVKELQNGQSNVPFTYKVVGNRVDLKNDGEVVSKHEGVRFPEFVRAQDSGTGVAPREKSETLPKSSIDEKVTSRQNNKLRR